MFRFVCFVVACVRVASFIWLCDGSSMSRVWRSRMDVMCGVYGCVVWMWRVVCMDVPYGCDVWCVWMCRMDVVCGVYGCAVWMCRME